MVYRIIILYAVCLYGAYQKFDTLPLLLYYELLISTIVKEDIVIRRSWYSYYPAASFDTPMYKDINSNIKWNLALSAFVPCW